MSAKVEIIRDSIRVKMDDGDVEVPSAKLPQKFLEWQSSARMELFRALHSASTSSIKVQPAHIAVLATTDSSTFRVNLASRGMGVLPKEASLERFSALFEGSARDTASIAPEESIRRRAMDAQQFYSDPKNFDERLLGGLEIFEGRSEKNIQDYPFASLLFSAPPPHFTSYQLNGVIEFVDKENPHYRFLRSARELFARDAFHVLQYDYPKGYIFHVSEVIEKTPRTRGHNVQKNPRSS
jgi:hypothetical protein